MEEEDDNIDDGIEDSVIRQDSLNNILPKAESNFMVPSKIMSYFSSNSDGPVQIIDQQNHIIQNMNYRSESAGAQIIHKE